ncbi:MAG: RluA family pseudouridine synthase [Candidatus Omnitrophica bacterium]|nr:RluA family pseudouridine synthase [Candidatus Omnitrophota bacterium]
MDIPIIYEDQWLLVVDKPSGLLTIPTPKKEKHTLTSILNDDFNKGGGVCRLHPCHRLDRDTSGLVIYAKGKTIQKRMMDEFRRKLVKKTYIAFVKIGKLFPQGEINSPIEGKPALTRYKIVAKKKDFAIVEAYPETGRTNQIRIHFQRIGSPILGEDRFAFRRDFKIKAGRLCLHASDLEFRHPVTKKMLHLHVGLPESLQKILRSY